MDRAHSYTAHKLLKTWQRGNFLTSLGHWIVTSACQSDLYSSMQLSYKPLGNWIFLLLTWQQF